MCVFYKIHPTYIDAIPNFFLTILSNLTQKFCILKGLIALQLFFLSFFFIFLFLMLKFLNNLDFYFVNLSVQMVSFSVK